MTGSLDGAAEFRQAMELGELYAETEDVAVLREAVGQLRESATALGFALTPVERADRYFRLGRALHTTFTVTGECEQLVESVQAFRAAVTLMAVVGGEGYVQCLLMFGSACLVLYEQNGDLDVLTEAVRAKYSAYEAAAEGHPHQVSSLAGYAAALLQYYEAKGDDGALDEGVAVLRLLVEGLPADSPDRVSALADLSYALRLLFELRPGDVALSEAEQAARRAVAGAEGGVGVSARMNLAAILLRRFERFDDVDALREGLALQRGLIQEGPPLTDARKALLLSNFGSSLRLLYDRVGDRAALREAVEAGRAAVAASSDGQAQQGLHLLNLGIALGRSSEAGDPSVLPEAAEVLRRSVAATPPGHLNRSLALANLGGYQLHRYSLHGDARLLDDGVRACREAVEASPDGHHLRANLQTYLGLVLGLAYRQTGDPDLADEAVRSHRAALAALPAGSTVRPKCLIALGDALRLRFETGAGSDVLDEGIAVLREAVAVTPDDDPAVAAALSNLGLLLVTANGRTGERVLLLEAIHVMRRALAVTPEASQIRRSYLANLSLALQRHFARTGEVSVLEEAVEKLQAAAADLPEGNPDTGAYWSGLGAAFGQLAAHSGDARYLEEGLRHARAAVEATPVGHPLRALYQDILAGLLEQQAALTGEAAILDEVIAVRRAAVGAVPAAHSMADLFRFSLLRVLRDRYKEAEDPGVLDEMDEVLRGATSGSGTPALVRVGLLAARSEVDAVRHGPQAALGSVEAVLGLIPQIAPRSWSRADREAGIGIVAGLAGGVAATTARAGRPDRAVEMLEAIRGRFVAEAIDDRRDLGDLHTAAPELAAEVEELRRRRAEAEDDGAASSADPLSAPGGITVPDGTRGGGWTRLPDAAVPLTSPGFDARLVALAERRRSLAEQWTAAVDRVRQLDGFEDFLAPPRIERLRRQAVEGPIVLLLAADDADDDGGGFAFIVADDPVEPVRVVALPALTADAARDALERLGAALDLARAHPGGRDLPPATGGAPGSARDRAEEDVHGVLGWLWDAAAGPVLDALGASQTPTCPADRPPRVWWCPVGVLAQLPLHAAGHHRDPARPTVLDRTVSSYIPTIRALEHARRPHPAAAGTGATSLIVAMPATPDAPPLRGVDAEVRVLTELLPGCEVLREWDATHAAVAEALSRHAVAHFACHAWSDRADPAASHLLLHDHAAAPLTVRILTRMNLAAADLAYLSACSTADTSPALADEAVHLTAAFQLAGYRRVIGTLWPVDDEFAAETAIDFGRRLTADGTRAPHTADSARYLAETVRRLRDKYLETPSFWAAHLHQGA